MVIEENLLSEEHHRYYGRPWALGKYQFEYLLSRGLKRTDKVLDFGCGSGRLGIWLIKYLDEGNYYGIDIKKDRIKAFSQYEVPLHSLESKRPNIICSNVLEFADQFDWVIDFFVTHHISDNDQIYKNIYKSLKHEGKYAIVPRNTVKGMSKYGFTRFHTENQKCPLLEGHSFSSVNYWIEFTKE